MKQSVSLYCVALSLLLLAQAQPAANCEPLQQTVPDGSSINYQKARSFSDSLADDYMHNRRKELLAKMDSFMRKSDREEEFDSILNQMEKVFGRVNEIEYKGSEIGYKGGLLGYMKPLRKFWYAIATTKAAKGKYFFVVEVVPDGDKLASAGFSIQQFVKGVPSWLK